MLSYFISVKHTTVAISVLLPYTAPIYVTLLSPLLLKEPVYQGSSIFALVLSNGRGPPRNPARYSVSGYGQHVCNRAFVWTDLGSALRLHYPDI